MNEDQKDEISLVMDGGRRLSFDGFQLKPSRRIKGGLGARKTSCRWCRELDWAWRSDLTDVGYSYRQLDIAGLVGAKLSEHRACVDSESERRPNTSACLASHLTSDPVPA